MREFSGTERTVAGYLVNEVLRRQRPEIRDLLLKTSILDRVSGPLADDLTGGSGSERVLQDLEEANAFVTSLDAGRTWFRYHRLFADFLRLELRRADPEASSPCERRRPAGTRSTSARSRPSGKLRRRRTGRMRRAYLRTATSASSSTAASTRSARCLAPSRLKRRARTLSWPSRSPARGCSRAAR